VLPATIDRTVHVAVRASSSARVRLRSINFEESAEYTVGEVEVNTLPAWARYVAGVAEELSAKRHALGGFDAVIQGNVPLGAGLSSSAALEVATAVGLGGLFSLELSPVETAKLCQRVEQKHVGVECGIMDQFSSRIGRAGHALFLDCRSLAHEHVPLPLANELCLVVADSGVRRELASSKYNERRRECEEAARYFRQFDEEINALRDVPETLLREHGPEMPEPLFRRARHVVTENQRVERGTKLLAKSKMEGFGKLMNASHASLASDYEVSCEELDALAEAARDTDGVLGARMTGAGFGGCTVTLARQTAVDAFTENVRQRFTDRFEDRTPTFYIIEENVEAAVV
jgi:galactokinase